MRVSDPRQPGPRIFYLCARRAGSVDHWQRWIDDACRLGCDWLWIGGIEPRRRGVHPLAVSEPATIADDLAPAGRGESPLETALSSARDAGLAVAADFSPAFVDRASSLVGRHPDWFVRGPSGTPAVPAGMGAADVSALAECDFGGAAAEALTGYWSDAAERWVATGFDALVCRAAHRVPSAAWRRILAAARGRRANTVFWADALGADAAAARALADAGFEAFLSSACWWDFHADWFLDQEQRLRRVAPTIAFPEEPGGVRVAAGVADVAGVEQRARFRFRFAAAAAWGVVVPMGFAQGWRRPLGEAGPDEPGLYDLTADIAAVNALRSRTGALCGAPRLRRLTGAAERACVLAVESGAEEPPLLAALNPDESAIAEASAGGWFQDLDGPRAAAEEITPGRTPETLDAGSRLPLEPLAARWFRIRRPPRDGPADRRAGTAPPQRTAPIAIEAVRPAVGDGSLAVKRTLGESVTVSADLIAEGHGRLGAALRYRGPGDAAWREAAFDILNNDRWRGTLVPDRVGDWVFQVCAWRARFAGWREDCLKRRDAGQDLTAELAEGEALLREAAAGAHDAGERAHLEELAGRLSAHADEVEARADLLLGDMAAELVGRHLPREGLSTSAEFRVCVERGRALAGAWYECFPRSLGRADRHGTFDDLIAHLPYIAGLGFDVVYLPPIHPIGHTNRKGRNNALEAAPDDPGSPWAIGSEAGGHTSVHPDLGTLQDFRRLVAAARDRGLEVALDFAIQCSPDHPWIREHPEWFRWRSDGTIRYAENPPKKYEDIVNVDFFGPGRDTLWRALRDVVLFWCDQGVRLFRVDNPHTKPLPFWEWLIDSVRRRHPDIVFLAEAFTRPKVMHRLAKIGFSQSYTYFTWRNGKEELTQYLEELAGEPERTWFRPNFWVNTPDINPYYLQTSGRPGFVIRAALAATMVASWGLYSGYELCEAEPLRNADGSAREEYLHSEKYELKHRDFTAPGNIVTEVTALNRIRRDNPALRAAANIAFHRAWDDAILFYSRRVPGNVLWMLVSLDPHNPREADLELPLEMLGAHDGTPVAVEELLGGGRWTWYGRRQRIRIEPAHPAMVLRVTTES